MREPSPPEGAERSGAEPGGAAGGGGLIGKSPSENETAGAAALVNY